MARSQAYAVSYLATGKSDGADGDALPFPVTYAILRRGQERFNVYCSPCHSKVGNGKGEVVQRGYHAAGDMQSDRLRTAPLGHFFDVITHGHGAMPSYADQVAPVDRWAIAAYIRALQLSQNADQIDVPAGIKPESLPVILRRSGYSDNFLTDWDSSFAVDEATAAVQPSQPTQNPKTPAPALKDGMVLKTGVKPVAPTSANAATTSAQSTEPEAKEKGDADRGKTVYTANCSACHQPTRAGLPPVFPSLIDIVARVGEEKVRRVARAGIPDANPPMPAHPNLTDADVDDLVAYLRTK